MSSSTEQSDGVAVFCASSLGKEKAFEAAATSLGKAIALSGKTLVYGSGKPGLMGVVSNSALKHGGRVLGITPYPMFVVGGEKEKTNIILNPSEEITRSDELCKRQMRTIIVSSMHERKYEMAKCSGGFVGLPGGFGSYDEIIEAVTWNQLNIHEKPVVVLNVLSFYTPLKELVENGVRMGFIHPSCKSLLVFIDGPSDFAEHERFDWGTAALHALDTWQRDPKAAYPYDWSKRKEVDKAVEVDRYTYI